MAFDICVSNAILAGLFERVFHAVVEILLEVDGAAKGCRDGLNKMPIRESRILGRKTSKQARFTGRIVAANRKARVGPPATRPHSCEVCADPANLTCNCW